MGEGSCRATGAELKSVACAHRRARRGLRLLSTGHQFFGRSCVQRQIHLHRESERKPGSRGCFNILHRGGRRKSRVGWERTLDVPKRNGTLNAERHHLRLHVFPYLFYIYITYILLSLSAYVFVIIRSLGSINKTSSLTDQASKILRRKIMTSTGP